MKATKRGRHLHAVLVWAASILCLLGGSHIAAAALGPEQVGVASLPAGDPIRLYVFDFVLGHIVDGRLHVIDENDLRYLGVIGTGMAGQAVPSRDGKEIYVVSTFYSRLDHGTRVDAVEIYDSKTLQYKSEIEIPPRHAQAIPYRGILTSTVDGHYLLIQNATPAQSVSIVDLKTGKLASEIPLPGCWTIHPWKAPALKFSSICGDGTLVTVELDAQGQKKLETRSDRFFDPDKDPIFVHAESKGDAYYFVSFSGVVHVAHLSGAGPTFDPPWPLVPAAEAKQAWRPGGLEVMAISAPADRLFVTMHDGGREGSHKDPAKEIWEFDLTSHQRVARLPGHHAISIVASQTTKPRLFAIDGLTNSIVVFDTSKQSKAPRELHGAAEMPVYLELW